MKRNNLHIYTFKLSDNIPYNNNVTRVVYSFIQIVSAVITIVSFGFVQTSWPEDYLNKLIFKRF